MRRDPWTHIALIPSVYGLVFFALGFVLYQFRFIDYQPTNAETTTLCVLAIVIYACSAIFHATGYRLAADGLTARVASGGAFEISVNDTATLAVLHVTGFVGLGLYVRALIDHFGSLPFFMLALTQSSYEVRWASEEIQTIGIQLTYAGWFAIALTAHAAARGRARVLWILVAVMQLAGNLLFVDRTRPFWILVTCGLIVMAGIFHRLRGTQLLRLAAIACASLLCLFAIIGLWVGKVSLESGQTGAVQALLQPIYYYITSSFAYLNTVVDMETYFPMIPERSLYPLFKVLESFGMTDPPPPQINPFYLVPVRANTGTILEPLYRDGGILYATVGFALLVFFIDSLGIRLLRNGTFVALFAWANLCFSNLLAFFTPKFNNTPFWAFVSIGTLAVLLSSRSTPTPIFGRIRRVSGSID